MQTWFDNLWNNSPWILSGMIIVLSIQLVALFIWEYYMRDYIISKNAKLTEGSE